jgi:death-on-curing protein
VTRYITLAEYLLITEFATGFPAEELLRSGRIDLADSALHAHQAGFGEQDFYPDMHDKAAVLCWRLARNHPLPDGNKRAA